MRIMLVPKPINLDPLLANPRSQPSEIAIRRNETEAGKTAGVEQVHGIDDHGAVGGVFAGRVGELLDGDDGVLEQAASPAFHARAGPVAVDAAHAGGAVVGDFGHEACYYPRGDVVGVDEDGDVVAAVVVGHSTGLIDGIVLGAVVALDFLAFRYLIWRCCGCVWQL